MAPSTTQRPAITPPDPPRVIGVVGAGTMGRGIAQLACQAGARTLLYDPIPDALEHGIAAVQVALARGAARGRWRERSALEGAGARRLDAVAELSGLAPCELVIEAAPERLELKRELFAELSGIVRPTCVLATNTSSLSVTAVASASDAPERVVGMHFFNPAPRMPLVEIVAGTASTPQALAVARRAAEAMGRSVIVAADRPGFLVNRCTRPLGLEALRLVELGLATAEQVDRICRLGAGLRMGPFEVSDLIGLDVGLDVARSLWEQSFGEPRWRPSPLSAQLVAAGQHGRKTGRGWYVYPDDGPHRAPDPEPPEPGGGDGLLAVSGASPVSQELRGALHAAGWRVRDGADADPGEEIPWLVLDCDPRPDTAHDDQPPHALACVRGSLAALARGGPAVGFHLLAPLESGRLVEATRTPGTSPLAVERLQLVARTLGKHVEWVGDAPGLVLGRIVAQLVNEAAWAEQEGVASAPDIDRGPVLGLNLPRGPLEWGRRIGLEPVVAVLDALRAEEGDERYRACPALRHRLWWQVD